jgi:hypothetical protein
VKRNVVALCKLEPKLGSESPFDMDVELDFRNSSYEKVMEGINLLLPW